MKTKGKPFLIPRLAFAFLLAGLLFSCGQDNNYRYLMGNSRCENGIQDPDEFGLDCGGSCSRECLNVRYLNGELFRRLSLESRYEYILTGPLIIRDGASLELPPGTHLKVQAGVGAYIAVAQGGYLFAWGNEQSPVTISSNAPQPEAGDWGGIIFCGKAPLASNETELSPLGYYFYGGNDMIDSSGYLRYLKIEHTGAAYDDENAFNALTFYGVGSYTSIDHVWINNTNEGGVAIVGGTVNMNDMVVTEVEKNAFQIEASWKGNGSRWYAQNIGQNGIFLNANNSSASFTLENSSIIDAGENGIYFEQMPLNGAFRGAYMKNVPLGVFFEFTPTAEQPFDYERFFFQNMNEPSNSALFNSGFLNHPTTPFENASSLPHWTSLWISD